MNLLGLLIKIRAFEADKFEKKTKDPDGQNRKGNSFYDDVMQAVFSFFFSFLFLSSLEVLWTTLLSVPLARRLCPHTL